MGKLRHQVVFGYGRCGDGQVFRHCGAGIRVTRTDRYRTETGQLETVRPYRFVHRKLLNDNRPVFVGRCFRRESSRFEVWERWCEADHSIRHVRRSQG